MDDLGELIARARARPGFLERLEQRVREDRPILDALAADPHDGDICDLANDGTLCPETGWCEICPRWQNDG